MVVAHGIGGRQDLPIDFGLALGGAVVVLLVSFAAVGLLWRHPRLRGTGGLPLPRALQAAADSRWTRGALRLVGLGAFGYVAVAALFGPDDALNPTALAVFVVFWIGLVPASLLLGPVWRLLSPWRTVHDLLAWAGRQDPAEGHRRYPERLGYWPAALTLLAFLWLELVAPDRTSTGTLRTFFGAYAAVMVVGAGVYGSRWFERADGFEVWSTLLSRMAPLGRRRDGRLALRNPLDGLTTVPARPGLAAVLVVVLGGTAYDGVSRTSWWLRFAQHPGRDPELVGTLGLLGVIAIAGLTYTAGCLPLGHDAPDRFGRTLVPIAAGYSVAHYFSSFVFDGQRALVLLTDPLGTGADLLGTAGRGVDFTVVSITTIAVVRANAVVLGHVLAVFSAHDRALEVLPPREAVLRQVPLILAMVGYTLTALFLLL